MVSLVSPTELPGSPLKMSMCSHCLRLLSLSRTSNPWGVLPTVPAKTILIQTSRQPHLCKARGQFHVSSSAQGTADGSCFLKLCLALTLFSPGSSLPWLRLFPGLLYQFLLISASGIHVWFPLILLHYRPLLLCIPIMSRNCSLYVCSRNRLCVGLFLEGRDHSTHFDSSEVPGLRSCVINTYKIKG